MAENDSEREAGTHIESLTIGRRVPEYPCNDCKTPQLCAEPQTVEE